MCSRGGFGFTTLKKSKTVAGGAAGAGAAGASSYFACITPCGGCRASQLPTRCGTSYNNCDYVDVGTDTPKSCSEFIGKGESGLCLAAAGWYRRLPLLTIYHITIASHDDRQPRKRPKREHPPNLTNQPNRRLPLSAWNRPSTSAAPWPASGPSSSRSTPGAASTCAARGASTRPSRWTAPSSSESW